MSIILDGTTGITTPADTIATSNLNFTGTGQRITGDMSNATLANRLAFQSSTTNGVSILNLIPNGTAKQSAIWAFDNSTDQSNSAIAAFGLNAAATEVSIQAASVGTGTYLPMTFRTNSTTQMTIATDGTITGTKGNLQLISGTAVASTSGTSIDFTGIPSWAKRITVMFSGVSTNGTSIINLLLGTGGTPTYATSGYLGTMFATIGGSAAITNLSTAITTADTGVATWVRHGSFTFTNITGNTWTFIGTLANSDTVRTGLIAGSIPLGAALTAVRITTVNGTDTFDAGSINIMYE